MQSPSQIRRPRLGRVASSLAALTLATLAAWAADTPRVVINEIFYHAPEDVDDLQYLELHNPSAVTVDLAGWSFNKGIKFTFPAGSRIEANGYLVLAQNKERFAEYFEGPVAGTFASKLSHKGERLTLVDASGKIVDDLKFEDGAPWPTGPDGHSGALERVSPNAPSNDPANWISSPLSLDRVRPTGTPGRANAGYSAALPPVFTSVKFSPEFPEPGQPISVEAELADAEAAAELTLFYRSCAEGNELPESALSMKRVAPQRYTAQIPGHGSERLIRFYIQATGANRATRQFPAATEPRPALSAYVRGDIERIKIPSAWVLQTFDPSANLSEPRPEFINRGRRGPRGRNRGPAPEPASRGPYTSAFVYFDPAVGKLQLFDFVQVNGRKGGQKVHFSSDQKLNGMSTVALTFEGETAAIVEPLAYEVYRRAGMPVQQSYYVRLWQNSKPVGVVILVEQPNRTFLRRHNINEDGNMYKLLWYGGDLVGQHEKHSHRRGSHDDIIEVVQGLHSTSGDAQWAFIQKHFDVNEVATYFAVNTILSHWDGFFNNYFAYHDSEGTGKWMMFPWDQDSTWGLRDIGGFKVYYDMALTFGMEGDEPPRNNRGHWRPPGFFSGAMLANPQFRQIFLARTKELLETVYTEEIFRPIIDSLRYQLTPEFKLRAQLSGRDPEQAAEFLKFELARCMLHLKERREFLLDEPELKRIKFPR